MFDLVNVFETFLPQVGAAWGSSSGLPPPAWLSCAMRLPSGLSSCATLRAWLPQPWTPRVQLLLYPNPSDPLNGEAAALHMRDPVAYQKKVGRRSTFPLAQGDQWAAALHHRAPGAGVAPWGAASRAPLSKLEPRVSLPAWRCRCRR